MTRDEIVDLIRNSYDPKPAHWLARESGWNDGAEEIADKILSVSVGAAQPPSERTYTLAEVVKALEGAIKQLGPSEDVARPYPDTASEPVAWRYRYVDHNPKWTLMKNKPSWSDDPDCECEPLFTSVAQGSLDPATVEACAKFVEQHQERITETERGSERSVSPRMVGNQMGLAFATGIRGLAVSSTEPRCTCAAIVNPNIPHARTCPLSSPKSGGAA